jgi:hypothetical protein
MMNDTFLFRFKTQNGTVKMDIVERNRKAAVQKASKITGYAEDTFGLEEVIENWEENT